MIDSERHIDIYIYNEQQQEFLLFFMIYDYTAFII